MKQWVGLGKFLAGHMQAIVPICVALGVLFPQQIAYSSLSFPPCLPL